MSYEGEQEWKPNRHRAEDVKIPHYTQYEPCILCGGKGYSVFQFIKRPCWACRGKGKLPRTNADGQFAKRE